MLSQLSRRSLMIRWRKSNVVMKLITFLLFLFITWLLYIVISKYHSKVLRAKWLHERQEFIAAYRSKEVHTEVAKDKKIACNIPKLDPFSTVALSFMEYQEAVCTLKRYGFIKNEMFILPADGINSVTLQYIRRTYRDSKEITKDNDVKFTEKINLQKNEKGYFEHKLEEDFIKVTMYLGWWPHEEYHAHISKNTIERKHKKKLKNISSGVPLNIIMVMIDSQSNANFQRNLIKTMPVLQKDKNTMIFQGHTMVADGTTGQLTAMFTGIHEKDLPESRRGFPDTNPVDVYPWIFKKLHSLGYATYFSETGPKYAAFNYRLHGFKDPPATHYLRPHWLGLAKKARIPTCDVKYNIKYLKEFTETYEDEAKFAYCAFGMVAHDDISMLQTLDDDLLALINFYKNPIRADNTMLIFFGDHGARTGIRSTYQGKMEERLPFLSITLPNSFRKKYPVYFENIKHNSKYLTSHYDLYATFEHLLSHPTIPDQSNYVGQSLFTHINQETRTCSSSGVMDHWCPCLSLEKISTESSEVKKIVMNTIQDIRKQIKEIGPDSVKCATVEFDQIISAEKLKPTDQFQTFKETKRDDVCDSCGLVLDKNVNKKEMISYSITFQTKPGNAQFEVTAKLGDYDIISDSYISRVNRYGDAPDCVAELYPHIRPYCYCL